VKFLLKLPALRGARQQFGCSRVEKLPAQEDPLAAVPVSQQDVKVYHFKVSLPREKGYRGPDGK
jgi:hypothetical protein